MKSSEGRADAPARSTFVFMALTGTAILAIALSLMIGSVTITPLELWNSLRATDTLAHALVFELRLPRTLTAFGAGGALAIAGVLMQVLLRNPLADPFVMGVSGGASVAALTAMLIGLSGAGVDVAAFVGALGATLLVFSLAHGEGNWSPTRLLLIGVIVAAAASAVVGLLLTLGDEGQLRGMLFWLMGDLAFSADPSALLVTLLAAIVIAVPFARHLNVLARSELQARILGAPVDALRIGVFIASSALTAVCVTTAGPIGFVGLVTPHIARLLLGADHRRVLPAAALLGGSLVTVADLAGRTLFAPRQLPVGAITALIGAPVFLMLLRRGNTPR
jgi:iron complex transport system permease protein